MRKGSPERRIVIDSPDSQIEAIAIDWIAENIYWSSGKAKLIEVSRLDGSHRLALVHENLEGPKAMAVDPLAGYLFWTDNSQISKIERSALDGSERNIIYRSPSIISDMTIDYKRKKIMWCDVITSYIRMSNYDGSGLVRMNAALTEFVRPLSIDVVGDTLYSIERLATLNLKKTTTTTRSY